MTPQKPIQTLAAASLLAILSASAHAEVVAIRDDIAGLTTITSAGGRAKALAISAKSTAFIRFDTAPTGIQPSQVAAARLTIYFASVTKPGSVSFHNLTTDFTEAFPEKSKPVPTFNATAIDTQPAVKGEFLTVDVTAQVLQWLANPATGFGVAIKSDGAAVALMASKEGAGSGHPALLEIDTNPNGVSIMNSTGTAGVSLGISGIPGSLDVFGDNATEITSTIYADDSSAPLIVGQKARGTKAAPTAVQEGDELANFNARGYSGSQFSGSRAKIVMSASENWSSTNNGTEISFQTTPNGSAGGGILERMRITHDGIVRATNSFSVINSSGRASIGPSSDGSGLGASFSGSVGGGKISFSQTASTERWTSGMLGGGGYGFQHQDTEVVRIKPDGSVGIGTTEPGVKGKLEVNGTAGGLSLGAFGSYGATAFAVFSGPNGTGANSIYASGRVTAFDFIAFSDERIKRIEGRSDMARDLATLQGIEVTDYTYIDKAAKGSGKHKKVIAQQVEKVYPQAVSRSTDEVPDIYQMAAIKNGWVQLATNLKKGERVRLIGEKKEGIHEVMEVEQGRFRTDFVPEGDKVFVYGREVKDFRSVDYEAIAMLNVSATQELARKLEKQEAECTKLREANAALAQKLAALAARDKARSAELTRLQARDEAREARLTRLEAALDEDRPARTVSASLDLK